MLTAYPTGKITNRLPREPSRRSLRRSQRKQQAAFPFTKGCFASRLPFFLFPPGRKISTCRKRTSKSHESLRRCNEVRLVYSQALPVRLPEARSRRMTETAVAVQAGSLSSCHGVNPGPSRIRAAAGARKKGKKKRVTRIKFAELGRKEIL